MLVYIDTFSGWVDAYPNRNEKSSEVMKDLLKEIIPHFDLPSSIQNDNGPGFVSEITWNQVETPHGMETSGFWEGREDESHLEEKHSQALSRNSSPLGSSLAYWPAQEEGGSSKWDSGEPL